jgi:hypothetical protein
MSKIRVADYCCQGGDKVVDRMAFTDADLVISREGKRELIFSPLGNQIFTTSLVKCCLRVNGSYKYAAPDIAASRAASHCLSNRFLRDIETYDTIRHVVIFGDPGWEAVSVLNHQGMPIKQHLKRRGIAVLNMPHFAQNFQQRAIYVLSPSEDEAHFRNHPTHRPYWPKAARMRSSTIKEVKRFVQRSS